MDQSLLHDVLYAARLYSLPDVYIRLRQIIDNPEYTAAEVAEVIDKDPAITMRLLRLTNSSFYSFSSRVDTVSRAVTLLGRRQIHDLVLGMSIALTFKGITSHLVDMQRFWRQSVYCAVACRLLADRISMPNRECIVVTGLLHDIGHLIMYQTIPGLSQQALMQAQAQKVPVHLVERAVLGFDYAVVGGELMRLWELPESLAELVRYHLEPEQAQHYPVETALVHIGALLTRAEYENDLADEVLSAVPPQVWSLTGLTPEECIGLHESITLNAESVMHLFP
jgi:Predicted signal transduction protein